MTDLFNALRQKVVNLETISKLACFSKMLSFFWPGVPNNLGGGGIKSVKFGKPFYKNSRMGSFTVTHLGGGKALDLLRHCLIYMESYSTERYKRGREVSKTINLALRNG